MSEKSNRLRVLPVVVSGGAPGVDETLQLFIRLNQRFNFEVMSPVIGFYNLFEPAADKSTRTSPKYLQRIAERSSSLGIDFLLIFGGRGAALAAHEISQLGKIPIGILPITVENDLLHCDRTVGFDSAVDIVSSILHEPHFNIYDQEERILIIEVAGRDSGVLAVEVGLAIGAQSLIFPENPENLETIAKQFAQFASRSQGIYYLVVNEGRKPGRAYDLAENLRKVRGIGCKVAVVSELQRRARISGSDKVLAAKFVVKCAEYIGSGRKNFMVGFSNGKFSCVPLDIAIKNEKRPSLGLVRLAKELYL